MSTKIEAYGCWSNERYIAVSGSAGCIHSMLFETPEAAKAYYKDQRYKSSVDDPIVKVTIEMLEPQK